MKRFSLLGVFFILSCAVGPNYERPSVDLPQSPVGGAEVARIPTEWWGLFQDDQLKSFVQEALLNNQDVQVAVARLDEARALAGISRADFYPVVDLTGQIGEGQVSSVSSIPLVPGQERQAKRAALGFTLSYEIDFWGKIRRMNEASVARLKAADYNRVNVQLMVSSSVAASYIHLRALDAQRAIAQQTYESRKESNRLIEKRYKGGVRSELDSRQAEAEMQNSLASLMSLENQVSAEESRLGVLLGRSAKALIESPYARGKDLASFITPPSLPMLLPSDILARRPDIMAAEQALVAENAQIGVAKSYYFPSISLLGMFGTDASELDKLFTGESQTWSYGLNLFMPIFNAGKTGYYVEAATARQKAAVAEYQKSIRLAFTEVRDSLKSYDYQGKVLEAKTAEVLALARNVQLADLRYRNGQSPYLEVLDAERRLFQAQLTKVTAQEDQLQAAVALYKALGGGWNPQ